MKQILVIADPIENNQIAFGKALGFTKNTIASIHILTFCHESLGTVEQDRQPEIQKMVMERHKQWWENYLTNHIVESRVSYEVIWEKHIHHSILDHCKEQHYDLIVKTGRRSESFFHTPSDWQLFRKSHIPVYSVTVSNNTTSKNILVCLDLMSKRKEKQQMNQRLIEAGFQFAMQNNAELHCCYVIEIPQLTKDMELVDVQQKFTSLLPRAKAAAAELMDVYEIDDQHLHIIEGKASTAIVKLAGELTADCVVIGSMGRSGIISKLIGNTAEEVIHYTQSDLMVISPQ